MQRRKGILPDMPKDGKGVVKVMYFHEQSFHQKYGDGLNQFIEKENPDLILVDAEQLTALAEKGKLLPLDAVLKQERFDTAGIPSLTMDFFRQLGGGHIYALSPTYNVEAIYYNADLFREHGIEPPRNQMTWEELFELASRFGQLGNSPTSSKSLQGNSTFEVGIVTMPVNPANPGVSPFMSFSEMFAINSNSPISELPGNCYRICAARKWPRRWYPAIASVCQSAMRA
ncbi:hypothetical protein DOE73_05350 [Paenibacillus dendritiformis]|nr:hypothetical protein DOE73_05350 [Paenibacillus dendritiformis]